MLFLQINKWHYKKIAHFIPTNALCTGNLIPTHIPTLIPTVFTWNFWSKLQMKICSHSENQIFFWVCSLRKSVKLAKNGWNKSILCCQLLGKLDLTSLQISGAWMLYANTLHACRQYPRNAVSGGGGEGGNKWSCAGGGAHVHGWYACNDAMQFQRAQIFNFQGNFHFSNNSFDQNCTCLSAMGNIVLVSSDNFLCIIA